AQPGESQRLGDVFDPATGRCIRQVPLASAGDGDRALSAAAEAFTTWSRTPPLVRARVLFRFRELAEAEADVLSRLVTEEHGKVLTDARGELTRGMEVVEFACGIPQLLKGEVTEEVGRNVDAWSMRQQLGVVTWIDPFNFQLMVAIWKRQVGVG